MSLTFHAQNCPFMAFEWEFKAAQLKLLLFLISPKKEISHHSQNICKYLRYVWVKYQIRQLTFIRRGYKDVPFGHTAWGVKGQERSVTFKETFDSALFQNHFYHRYVRRLVTLNTLLRLLATGTIGRTATFGGCYWDWRWRGDCDNGLFLPKIWVRRNSQENNTGMDKWGICGQTLFIVCCVYVLISCQVWARRFAAHFGQNFVALLAQFFYRRNSVNWVSNILVAALWNLIHPFPIMITLTTWSEIVSELESNSAKWRTVVILIRTKFERP